MTDDWREQEQQGVQVSEGDDRQGHFIQTLSRDGWRWRHYDNGIVSGSHPVHFSGRRGEPREAAVSFPPLRDARVKPWYRSPAFWRAFRPAYLVTNMLLFAGSGIWAFVYGLCLMPTGWRAAGTVLLGVLLLAISMACCYGYTLEDGTRGRNWRRHG